MLLTVIQSSLHKISAVQAVQAARCEHHQRVLSVPHREADLRGICRDLVGLRSDSSYCLATCPTESIVISTC
eukprot:5893672-Amphidinium_carterae.2